MLARVTVSTICLLFGMLNGLTCFVTSLASKRAAIFNCEHLHRLFCIGTNFKFTVKDIVEKALKKLDFNPKKRALILSLNLLVIEETGLVSAELLTIIDMIVKHRRLRRFPQSTNSIHLQNILFKVLRSNDGWIHRMLLEKLSEKPISEQDIFTLRMSYPNIVTLM